MSSIPERSDVAGRRPSLGALVAFGLGATFGGSLGCGGDLACGPGTHEEASLCVVDAVAPGAPGGAGGNGDGGAAAASTVGVGGSGAQDPGNVLENLPPCEPAGTDGSIDFSTGCVAGACTQMTYAEFNAAIGSSGICEALSPGDDQLLCEWSRGGISAFFDDLDTNGVPDTNLVAGNIFLNEPYPGGTVEGLGIGATMRCFVEVLGQPTNMTLEGMPGDALLVSELEYGDFDVLIDDMWTGIDLVPDGHVDGIAIFGPITF